MARNQRAVDRVIPASIGGYVVNYGFVPQTVSYDGDPFDALVLGPPIDGGSLVRGVVVGLFRMADEKGDDAKVVLSRLDAAGRPAHTLTPESQRDMEEFFRRYKDGQPGLESSVAGWGTVAQGRAHVTVTHAFFTQCAARSGAACQIP
jgi:inorganic pyrophosphatase